MKSKGFLLFFLLLIVVFVFGVVLNVMAGPGATITVGAGFDHQTLAEAITAASSGDTILVKATYDSSGEIYPVTINKGVEIDCENNNVSFENVGGPSTDNYFLMSADDITIQNCDFVDVGINNFMGYFELTNNTFTLSQPVGFVIGGGRGGVIASSGSWISGSDIIGNDFNLNFSSDGVGTINIIDSIFGTAEYPVTISGNYFSYSLVPTDSLGATVRVVGGVNEISYNYIDMPDANWDDGLQWRGIDVSGREDFALTSNTNITHNTIDLGGASGVDNYGILYYDYYNDGVPSTTVSTNISYNLIYNQANTETTAIRLVKNDADTSMSVTIDYNGFFGVGSYYGVDGNYENDIVINYGENNLENIDPLFRTNSLNLSPVSAYLDVDEGLDIGAYSASRATTIYIDDDALVNYTTVHSNSTDIIQYLRNGDDVNIASGTYDNITVENVDSINITGQGATTIIAPSGSENGIALDNANQVSISNLTIEGVDETSLTYTTARPNFVFGEQDYDGDFFYIDMIGGNDGLVPISENDQDISSIIENYPNEGFDIALISDENNVVAIAPDSLFASAQDVADAFEMPLEMVVAFVEDAVIYSDGMYLYQEATAAVAGITISSLPSTFYINSTVNYPAGVKFINSSSNELENLSLGGAYYGVWFDGESDGNVFTNLTISDSFGLDIYSTSELVEGSGNYFEGLATDTFTNSEVTGNLSIFQKWAPAIQVIGENDEPVFGITITVENDISDNEGVSAVTGNVTKGGGYLYLDVAEISSEGLSEYYDFSITSTETEDYDSVSANETLEEHLQEIVFDLLASSAPARSSLHPSPWLQNIEEDENLGDETEEETMEDVEDETPEMNQDEESENEGENNGDNGADSQESKDEEIDNKPIFPEERTLDFEKEGIREFIKRFKKLPTGTDWQSIHFIAYGNLETIKLTIVSRAGLVEDYFQIYESLPVNENDWNNLMLIYNGLKPKENNSSELLAKRIFNFIFKRPANLDLSEEKRFIEMVAYYIRPVNRDLDKEKIGLSKYTKAFGTLPSTPNSWAILRALAYTVVR